MRTQKADRFRSAPHYENSPFLSLFRNYVRRSEVIENPRHGWLLKAVLATLEIVVGL